MAASTHCFFFFFANFDFENLNLYLKRKNLRRKEKLIVSGCDFRFIFKIMPFELGSMIFVLRKRNKFLGQFF